MPTMPIEGTDLKYLLISYDSNGVERTDDPEGRMSDKAEAALRDGVTDVFLLSHGWKGDLPAAKDQFNRWIKSMVDCTDDRARIRQLRPGFKSLVLGLHWPSQPWGDESVAAGGAPSFALDMNADGNAFQKAIDYYAENLAQTPRARQALETIFASAEQNIAPRVMPEEVTAAYLALNEETGMGSAGVGSAPGDDREPFDPQRAYKAAMRNEREFGSLSLGGILSPLRQLSFWMMKSRGRSFGEKGGTDLLRRLQTVAPTARFHVMGHSFGCVVMSSILAGPKGQGSLVRPVDTAILIQGALSFWAYCSNIPSQVGTPGYYNSIVKQNKVKGPLLVTMSEFDKAVGVFYPIAAGITGQVAFGAAMGAGIGAAVATLPKYGGIGTFGVRGPGMQIVDAPMLPMTGQYNFQPGKVYNLDSNQYIRKMDGSSGAHSDIAHPEVGHAFWQAIMS